MHKDISMLWTALAILAGLLALNYILDGCDRADAQVGQPLWEDQFYDPTSTRDPVEVQIQENVNRYFDNLERSDETVTGNSLNYSMPVDDPLEAYPMVDDRNQE